MMTTRKPKSTSRRKSPPIQYCTYMLEVLDRKVRYSFSTNRDRVRTPGPYSEYAAIEITGKLILPEKHAETIIECTIYGRRDYDEFISKPNDFDKIQSGLVGMINISKDYSNFYGKHQIRMIFLNPTFQSPTGTVLSDRRREQVLEISAQLGIPIVEDDPVSLLSLEGERQYPLKSMDRNGNVLYVGSLSKVIASSLRVGWIIGPQSVINRLADARHQIDFGISIFPQLVAKQILQSPQYPKHLQFLRDELLERRNEMKKVLQETFGDTIEFTDPQGGLFIWCKMNKKVDDHKLVEEAIKNKILFMPGSVYGAPNGYVRFTYARLKKEDMREAITRFAEALSNI